MLCVVSEDTEQVIGERRMATLRDLGSDPSVVRTESEILAFADRQLGQNLRDLPFTLTYLFDEAGDAHLAGASGIAAGHPVAPAALAVGDDRGRSKRRRAASRCWSTSTARGMRICRQGIGANRPRRRWSSRCCSRAGRPADSWSPG